MINGSTSEPAPRPRLEQARECDTCRGWGTVVTAEGRHELCPDCQREPNAGRSHSGAPY